MTTNEPIDFTEWTDAQLEVGAGYTSSPNYPALVAEIERREAAGIWKTDGSHERVANLIATNPGLRRRRSPRK